MAAGINVLPFPIYAAPFRVLFPMLDADGDPVANCAGDTPDSERSLDCANFADCTNEMTEIEVDSGMYYLDLTAAEMTADSVAVIAKVAATAKTTPIVMYPRRLPSIRTGTAQAGAEGTITLDASASAVNSFYNGCYIQATNNDPAGIQGQTRLITAYVGATTVASIAPNWATTPTNATTFSVLVPENAIVSGYQGVVAPDLVAAASYTTTRAGYLDNLDAAVSTRSTLTAAQVNTEADTALSDINLDHLCKTATGAADMTTEVVDNSILARILANGDTSVFDPSTDGLQPLRDRGDAAWVTAAGFATPTNITGGTITTVTNLTNLPGTAALEATLATMKGATFAGATDSLEAIRNQGDAAWITGSSSAGQELG